MRYVNFIFIQGAENEVDAEDDESYSESYWWTLDAIDDVSCW